MANNKVDIEQLLMNLTMPEVVTRLPPSEQPEKKKKMRTREKIEKLVSEGAKNYPAYLKLVHTGDSDFSDNEEIDKFVKTRQNRENFNQKNEESTEQLTNTNTIKTEDVPKKEENTQKKSGRKWSFKRKWMKLSPGTPEEKKDPVKDTPTSEKGADENFYDTTEISSPEYDNAVNQNLPSPELDPEEKARQEEEWRTELAKLEDEITTLRQVLNSKVRHSAELKRKLGITPMREFQADLKQGFQNIKESDAYKKTSEKLSDINSSITESEAYKKTSAKMSELNQAVVNSQAFQKTNLALKNVGQKTTTVFSSFGAYTSRKLGDARNSNFYKSFEEKLGGAVTNVKSRMSGSQSEQNFGDALNAEGGGDQEMKSASASVPATPVDEKKPLS